MLGAKHTERIRPTRARAIRTGFQTETLPDGTVNGALFVAYIKQQVVPSLARGDVLIMDNLPVHKAVGARQAVEAAGITLLFLPAYSPGLNPIGLDPTPLSRAATSD